MKWPSRYKVLEVAPSCRGPGNNGKKRRQIEDCYKRVANIMGVGGSVEKESSRDLRIQAAPYVKKLQDSELGENLGFSG